MADAPDAIVVLLCADAEHVLVDRGELPSLRRPLRKHEGAIAPAWADWPKFGLPGPVLDTVLDPTRGRGGDDPYVSLVIIETPPGDHDLPTGWRWQGHGEALTDVPAGFIDHVDQWLAERRGNRPAPAARLPWNEPGWFRHAEAWIHDSLREISRATPFAITMTKLWGISAVWRVDAPDGVSWFKASAPFFAQEAAATKILRRVMPDRIPTVLAANRGDGWLLTDHIEGEIGGQDIIDSYDPAPLFTDVHWRSIAVLDELLAAGCPHRPIVELPGLVRAGLLTDVGRRYSDIPSIDVERLLSDLQRAVVHVEALAVPETVVHGDLHGGNVARTPQGDVVFDWSDACRSHPLVDVVTWTEMFRGDEAKVRATWNSFRDTWVETFEVPWFEPDVRQLELVGQAFLFDSYVKIVSSLEPVRHRECSAGISDAFDRMVELTQAAS